MSFRQASPAEVFGSAPLRLWFFTLLFLATGFPTAAQRINIAILGGDDTEPLRTVLTAEFSKLPEMAVVERAALDKIAREQSLQTASLSLSDSARVGKLAHADVLLLLTADPLPPGAKPDPTKVTQTLRIVATEAGIALTEEHCEMPVTGIDEWAALTAKRLSPSLAGFANPTEQRIPLSVLKIRAAVGDFKNGKTEKDLGFLLVRRLMHEPSLMVLERTQMGPLEWENALRAEPASSFLTGSYLLDGSFTESGGKYSAVARLRSPGGGEAIAVEAEATDLAQLADKLAGLVTARLATKPATKPWDRAAEADQYLQEALWAYRWRLLEECVQAAESAWALGQRSDTLALLRCTCQSNRVSENIYLFENRLPEKPAASRLEEAMLLCDYLSEGVAWKGNDLPEAWVGVAANSLWSVSRLLRAYYYAPGVEASEAEALQVIRGRVRDLCASLKPAAQRYPLPKLEEKALGFLDPTFSKAPENSFYTLRGVSEPIWQESAGEGIEKVRLLFDELDALPLHDRERVKHAILEDREYFAPWIAYWNEKERSQFSLADLRRKLLDAPSPERPIDVAVLMLKRRQRAFADHKKEPAEQRQLLLAIEDVKTAIAGAIEPIARGEISDDRLREITFAMRQAERDTNGYARPPLDAEFTAFSQKILKALLSMHVTKAFVLQVFTPQAKDLTPGERQEIYRLALEASGGKKEGYTRDLERDYFEDLKAPDSPSSTTPAAVALKPAWSVDLKEIVGDVRMNFPGARAADGKLWVFGSDVNSYPNPPNSVFQFDPRTWSTTRLPPTLDRSMASMFDLVVFQGDVLLLGETSLQRYHHGENSWEKIPTPASTRSRMWIIKDTVYVGGGPGLIYRFYPETKKVDILASSRRRPATTILDDVSPYEIDKIFEDDLGRICAAVDNKKIYRWDEEKRTWEKIFEVQPPKFPGSRFVPGPPPRLVNDLPEDLKPEESSLYLRAFGSTGISGGQYNNGRPGLGEFLLKRLFWPRPSQNDQQQLRRIPALSLGLSSVYGSVFDGTRLWWLTSIASDKKTFLQSVSVDGQIGDPIPLEIGEVRSSYGTTANLQVVADGLLVFSYPNFHFFRREDLEAAEHTANPAKP